VPRIGKKSSLLAQQLKTKQRQTVKYNPTHTHFLRTRGNSFKKHDQSVKIDPQTTNVAEKLYNNALERDQKSKLTIQMKEKEDKKREKNLMSKKKMLKESELYYIKKISRELLTAFSEMDLDEFHRE